MPMKIMLLAIFIFMVGLFAGLAGIMFGWPGGKTILVVSGIGLAAVFWLADAFKLRR